MASLSTWIASSEDNTYRYKPLLNLYFLFNKCRKYQSAVNDDLWKAMSNQSIEALELPSDITTIMNSWSLQTGYPIVTVRRNYDFQSAIVTQVNYTRQSFPQK
jgi:aminopeptidase N